MSDPRLTLTQLLKIVLGLLPLKIFDAEVMRYGEGFTQLSGTA